MLRNLNSNLPGGNRALATPFVGLLAADILAATASGDFGAGIFANDSLIPGKRYSVIVSGSTFPAGALQLRDDGGGQFVAAGSATLTILEDNLAVGTSVLQGVFSGGGGGDSLPQQWLTARPRVYKIPFDPNARLQSFSEKSPLETIWLVADFSAVMVAASNPQVLITRTGGAQDAAPASIADGAPQVIDGASVRQRVRAGVAGCNYTVTFLADGADGSRLAVAGLLPVRSL